MLFTVSSFSVLFCSSVTLASWNRQVWKYCHLPPLNDQSPNCDIQYMTKEHGASIQRYLFNHMVCFQSAANDMWNLEAGWQRHELKMAPKWMYVTVMLAFRHLRPSGFEICKLVLTEKVSQSPKIQSTLLPARCISAFLRGLFSSRSW